MTSPIPYTVHGYRWRVDATGTFIGADVQFGSGTECTVYAAKHRIPRRPVPASDLQRLGEWNGWHLTAAPRGFESPAGDAFWHVAQSTAFRAAVLYLRANVEPLAAALTAALEDEAAHLEVAP